MNLTTTVAQLRQDPKRVLSTECVLALQAFFAGYWSTNGTAIPLLNALAQRFDGPEAADACTRAYLTMADSRAAMLHVLDEAARFLADRVEPPPSASWGAATTLVEAIREPLLNRRIGMVLPEPTLWALHDFAWGRIFGLRAVRPEFASSEETQLNAFDCWMREKYEYAVPWYAIIRVEAGICEDGLRAFIRNWDEFQNGRPPVMASDGS